MANNILCFFTSTYPFDKGETFIENELKQIATGFEKVYLFHRYSSDFVREVPENVSLVFIDSPGKGNLLNILKGNFLLFFSLILHELFLSRQRSLFLAKLTYNLQHFANCIYYAEQIKLKLPQEILQNALFYSYWFFDWNLSLSILKRTKDIRYNITRAHGFDLYEEKGKPNYLPLRKFCLNYTDQIFTISKAGEKYLKAIYPFVSHKVTCSYLGTKDSGINPSPNSSQIHIVSCSNVIELKRLHLIIEILSQMTSNVLWTHIGEGLLLEDIRRKSNALPVNVKVNFKGFQTQDQIFEFYRSTSIDAFINTSISEGLPVSIMEAISFGIPVIATDVGGTSEIVNKHTGILISCNFKTSVVIEFLNHLKKLQEIDNYRRNVRSFWHKNFNAEMNYSLFYNRLNTFLI